MTTAQAAQRLEVSRMTVARWAETGRLPIAWRAPGRTGMLLFDPHDVERLAQKIAQARSEIA